MVGKEVDGAPSREEKALLLLLLLLLLLPLPHWCTLEFFMHASSMRQISSRLQPPSPLLSPLLPPLCSLEGRASSPTPHPECPFALPPIAAPLAPNPQQQPLVAPEGISLSRPHMYMRLPPLSSGMLSSKGSSALLLLLLLLVSSLDHAQGGDKPDKKLAATQVKSNSDQAFPSCPHPLPFVNQYIPPQNSRLMWTLHRRGMTAARMGRVVVMQKGRRKIFHQGQALPSGERVSSQASPPSFPPLSLFLFPLQRLLRPRFAFPCVRTS